MVASSLPWLAFLISGTSGYRINSTECKNIRSEEGNTLKGQTIIVDICACKSQQDFKLDFKFLHVGTREEKQLDMLKIKKEMQETPPEKPKPKTT